MLATLADVEALERQPVAQYRPETTVFELFAHVAETQPDKLAIRYLATASVDAPTREISYRGFRRRIIQPANPLYGLGVGSGDAVSMVLPILPATFFALFGA